MAASICRKATRRSAGAELDAWRKLSYADLAYEILSKFITDIPAADLKALVAKTYTAQVYCHTRNGGDAAQITPLTRLEDGLYTQELSNGPTLAFKDMAMQLLGNLFEYVLDKRGEAINILGATSGDTGSAAEYAMRGKHNVKVFMLSPEGKMSAFQRAQMYSLQDANIFNIAVTGMFDDAQDIVKAVSNDAAFKAKYKIGAVNSINWARVAAQIVYYFQGYFAGDQVAMTSRSPSPCRRATSATSAPATSPARWACRSPSWCWRPTRTTCSTSFSAPASIARAARPKPASPRSPSMDISKASNFERFVFDLVGRDPAIVRELWAKVDKGEAFDLSATVHWQKPAEIRFRFRQEHAHRPHQDHPLRARALQRHARHPYRRRTEGGAGKPPAGHPDDRSGNRPARQVRGNHPRGTGQPSRCGRPT